MNHGNICLRSNIKYAIWTLLGWAALLTMPANASTEQTCFTTSHPGKVVVFQQTSFQICHAPLAPSGQLYTIETTDNRTAIIGCLIGGHFPSGYTFLEGPVSTNCGPNKRGTWYLNQHPIGYGFTAQTPVNTPYSGSAATTDPDGDVLTYISGNSRVSVNANTGTFVYTPPLNFQQHDWFTVYASDGKGGQNFVIVEITVGNPSAQNQPPIFETFTLTVTQGVKTGLLLAAQDPEADPITIMLDQSQLPVHGTLVPIPQLQNAYHYTSQPNFVGSDSFAAFASDNNGNTTRTVFSIEVQPLDPNLDQDSDGMPNGYEQSNGLDPFVNDANLDLDGDGATNINEFVLGTLPYEADTDGDSISDGWEIGYGLNPLAVDAADDLDGDGLPNMQEYQLGTHPGNVDTDGDGMNDSAEVTAGTDPLVNLGALIPIIFKLIN